MSFPFVQSMTGQATVEFFNAVGNEVMKELAHFNEQASCITVSALVVRVLQQLGYPTAYPLTVRVSIFTERTYEWVKRNGIPKTELEWKTFADDDCVQAYIGYTPKQLLPKGHWSGHLAAVVPDLFPGDHGLVDFTLTQANRPELGINLSPVVLKVPNAFIDGRQVAETAIGNCRVIYEAFPKDKSFNEQGCWNDSPTIAALAVKIIERLKAC